jgi:hypothetical protein
VQRLDVPERDLIVPMLPSGPRILSPTLFAALTQFAPLAPVMESLILPVTLPGITKKANRNPFTFVRRILGHKSTNLLARSLLK